MHVAVLLYCTVRSFTAARRSRTRQERQHRDVDILRHSRSRETSLVNLSLQLFASVVYFVVHTPRYFQVIVSLPVLIK